MANYAYVVDSSFKPYSFDELVKPLTMYKLAYDESELKYTDLKDKADKFKYLSESMPEDSKARLIYQGYADTLNEAADDFSKHGLNMNNRSLLTDLRSRYSGEIGMLDLALKAKEQDDLVWKEVYAKDPTMLRALVNRTIDDYLPGALRNDYMISATTLYNRAAAASKAWSSRISEAGDAGDTIGGYYKKWYERVGPSADLVKSFYEKGIESDPELLAMYNGLAKEMGIDNLSGKELEKAKHALANGLLTGIVSATKYNPIQNPGVLTASLKADNDRGWASINLQKEQFNYEKSKDYWMYEHDKKGNITSLSDEGKSFEAAKHGMTYDPKTGIYTKVNTKTTLNRLSNVNIQNQAINKDIDDEVGKMQNGETVDMRSFSINLKSTKDYTGRRYDFTANSKVTSDGLVRTVVYDNDNKDVEGSRVKTLRVNELSNIPDSQRNLILRRISYLYKKEGINNVIIRELRDKKDYNKVDYIIYTSK